MRFFTSFFAEFRTFIQRGNVIDLAVGVIIGSAFGKIVSSLVADVLTPPLGLLLGNVHFTELKIAIGGTPQAPVTINYGSFLQAVFDFLIIAFCVFLLVKGVNALKLPGAQPPPPPAPSDEVKLLTEIRDLLKARAEGTPEAGGEVRV
jgi:large conductance mechanosensitive channel